MNSVLLCAASGVATGLGHVMRTRSVAQALADFAPGTAVVLAVDDELSAEALRSEGFEVHVGAESALRRGPFDAALLDGFRDWSDEFTALEAQGARCVLMENRTAARERCDALVYPGLHYVPDAWDLAHAWRVHAGPSWTPLARELLALAPAAEPDLDLVVSFGGSDPRHLTERALTALGPGGPAGESAPVRAARLAVVLGPHMADRRAAVERALRPRPGAHLVECPPLRGTWIARSRAVLTAVGTTLVESAWLGVPALILANYPGDRPALEHYREVGPHAPLGVAAELDDVTLAERAARALESLAGRPRRRLTELGGGSRRLAELLANPSS